MSGPSPVRIVKLIDLRVAGRPYVAAEVHRDCPANMLDRVEAEWADSRLRAAIARPDSLEHSHWNWRNKSETVVAGNHRLIVVECQGQPQGIMAVLRDPRSSRLGGGPVLYVDYLEVAPWNLLAAPSRRFAGIGPLLMTEAIHASLDSGRRARIGLHSLPQAEAFYRRCRITELGPDPTYHYLNYFEYTERQATDWLATQGEAT